MQFILRGAIVLILLVVESLPNVLAQEIEFQGKAIEVSSNEEIEGASVQLISFGEFPINEASAITTGKDGLFTFNINSYPIEEGDEIIFTVNHPEYATVDVTVAYRPGTVHVLQLQPKSLYVRLAGRVEDATTGEPIEFVAIQIAPADENSRLVTPLGAVTD